MLGDVNCSKHKLQPLLNRINLDRLGEDVTKIDSIAINLHVNDANDPKKVIQTTTIWIKGDHQTVEDVLLPEPEKDKKKKKDKK